MKCRHIISGLAAVVLTLSAAGVQSFAQETVSAVTSEKADSVSASGDDEDDDVDFTSGKFQCIYLDEDSAQAEIVGYTGTDTEVTVPAKVKDGKKEVTVVSLGRQVFFKNTTLTKVTVSEGVQFIDDRAFCYCSKLTDVSLASSVQALGDAVFASCTSLKTLKLPAGLRYFGMECFSGSAITSLSIPANIEAVSEMAFYKCKSLTSVTMPAKLTVIEDHAFAECSALTTAAIPSAVKSIGNFAFASCPNLTAAEIPSAIEELGTGAFCGTGITSAVLPAAVKAVPEQCFAECGSLTSVTIPSGVTEIGDMAFMNCPKLPSEALPDSVKTVGYKAFYGCTALKTLSDMKNVNSVGCGAFTGTQWLADRQAASSYVVLNGILIDASKVSGKAEVPASVTVINDEAFKGTGITSLVFKGRVTAIGESAFANCTKLTSADLGTSLQKLGRRAFDNCKALGSVVLPSSVKETSWEAFAGSYFTSVTVPDSIQSMDKQTFSGMKTSLSELNITKKSGKLTAKFGELLPAAGIINIEDGITEIETGFCTNENTKAVFIPETAEKIGANAVGYKLITTDPDGNEVPPEQREEYTDLTYTYKALTGFGIYCVKDSAAEKYAKNSKISYTYLGDINGDREFNNDDIVIAQQFSAKWNSNGDKRAADTNCDGVINNDDVILLQQYSAKWRVKLGRK